VSSDGYPAAVEALRVADIVISVAHAHQMTLPHIELSWHDGKPSLEVKWYPYIDKEKDPAVLVEQVRSAFVKDGDQMYDHGTYVDHSTDLHGVPIDFTIYTR
jgi:hypothetical protein